MSENVNNGSSGNSNGNGNGDAKLKIGVQQAMADNLKFLGSILVTGIAVWYFANASTSAKIEGLEQQLKQAHATFQERNERITKLEEARTENEVQHAYRGVETNMEAMISEMRSWYHSQCPSARAYERRYWPPQRLGKAVDG